MKKLNLIVIFAASMGLLVACHSNKDNKAKADSANTAKETTRNGMKDSAGAVVPHINVDAKDAKFAVEAANGGMAEVVLGKLAREKAASKQVKDFGEMMVTDHSKANDELKILAKKLKITLPDSISKDESKVRDNLAKKSGADFDKAYVKDMVNDHKKDVAAFDYAAKNSNDNDLKTFATRTLPVLKMHLDEIKKIQSNMK